MKKHHLFCLLSLLYGFFNPTLLLANDPSPETARLLASQCAQCHGTTGNSLGDTDSIAGEGFDDLLAELLEMKSDNDNKIMHKQIQAYTDQQLWFIADYYSRLPKISTELDILPDSEEKDRHEDEKLLEAEKKGLEKALKKALKKAKKLEKKAKKKAKTVRKLAKKKNKVAFKKAKKLAKKAKKKAKAARKLAKKKEKELRKKVKELEQEVIREKQENQND